MSIQELLNQFPRSGCVVWIGIRTKHRATITPVNHVEAVAGRGLVGDHGFAHGGKRQVTFLQAEHLAAIASFLDLDDVAPRLLRRNIVVKGINLLAFKERRFRVGDTLFEMTGLCHPCSRMEEALGAGGYNALRGHGGITARVLTSGVIRRADQVHGDNPEEPWRTTT